MRRHFANKVVYTGHWLRMHKLDFITSAGHAGSWEFVSRPHRCGSYDGVQILATVQDQGFLKLITIAMYRFPLQKYVLEMPSGKLDGADSSPQHAAIRELKEESGYIASARCVRGMGPVVYNDPWKSNECARTVLLEVDGALPENQWPQQALDPEEDATVHLLRMDRLDREIRELAQAKGYEIDSRLYSLGLGLAFGGNMDASYK